MEETHVTPTVQMSLHRCGRASLQATAYVCARPPRVNNYVMVTDEPMNRRTSPSHKAHNCVAGV